MNNSKRFRLRMVVPAFPPFNIYGRIAKTTTALGPICVATMANKLARWDVEVIDENNYRQGPKDENGLADHQKLQAERPADVVGFYGSMSSAIPRLYELAQLYQSWGVKTIAGGKHVHNLPEEALNHGIGVVAFGDGEKIISEVLLAWQNNQPLNEVAGIAFLRNGQMKKTTSRPLISDFEVLPLPEFHLLRYGKIKIFPVSWWRGCPYSCEFCSVNEPLRCSPAERIVANIIQLVENYGARNFFIVDDYFGGSHKNEWQKNETIRFCRLIDAYQKRQGRRLSFTVQIRITAAECPELLTAMRAAGINTLCIGFESMIDEELKAMNKGYDAQKMLEWLEIFRRFGFATHGMGIFGYPKLPGDEFFIPLKEKVKRFRMFIKHLDTAQVLLTVPIVGTRLRERLQAENRLFPLKQVGWEYYDGQFPLYLPDDGVAPEELQAALKKIMGGFYHCRHFWHLVVATVVGFPSIVFPSALSLMSFRVRYLVSAFRLWRKIFWRNASLRFGGYLIVRGFLKKFKEGEFQAKLREAKNRLTQTKKEAQ